MTVAELIEELKKQDKETEVMVDADGRCMPITKVYYDDEWNHVTVVDTE